MKQFIVSNEHPDQILKDLINSSSSTILQFENTDPTILSLQNTVDLIVKKYGPDWRKYPECKVIVIWASSNFIPEHVKEIVPDLYDLCMEYLEYSTINGKEIPDNIALLAFAVIDPNYDLKMKKE